MEDRRVVAVVTTVTVVFCVLLSVGVPVEVSKGAQTGVFPQFDISDSEDVLLQIQLEDDGDASWTVEYRILLDDSNSTDAFESLREEIRSNPDGYTEEFADRLRTSVRKAEDETGRNMSLGEVNVETEVQTVPRERGVVRYEFVWERFSKTDSQEADLVAGDAISGFYIDGQSTLLLSWNGYELEDSSPSPDELRDGVAVWNTETAFAPQEPRLYLVENGSATDTGTGSGDGTASRSGDETGDSGGSDTETSLGLSGYLVGGSVLILLLLTGFATYRFVNRREDDGAEELLSNEERVLSLVEEEGGRVKQKEVAERLNWTDSKTSKVVGKLDEGGEVDIYRLGRENVVALPEESLIDEDSREEE